MGRNDVVAVRTLDYGDARAHLMLWQKAIFLVPLWGMLTLPILGYVCRSFGTTASQLGFGLALAVFLTYFLEDLLKRKIRMDDYYLFFGFKAISIKDLAGIEVLYKKNKFLPTDLVLNSVAGEQTKFALNRLSDQSVETLLKHLQAKNSKLDTAQVLATLVKCRRLKSKALETEKRLELPIQSRRLFGETVEAYQLSARKWMRMGPLVTYCFFPAIWLSFVSNLYVCLQPHNYLQLQNLGLFQFLSNCSTAFLGHTSFVMSKGVEAAQPFANDPVTLTLQGAFFLCLMLYALKVFFSANSLIADGENLKFVFRCGCIVIPLKQIKWSQIERLNLHSHRGKIAKIRFSKRDGNTVDLDLTSVLPEHRALLLKRIEKQVPHCQIDQNLAESMLPQSNQNYTEIWLQSLTQTPERAALEPLYPGQLVGSERFEVLRSIGVGGQGTAYLCRHLEREGEPQVVLKETIIPVFANNVTTRKELEKFEREAKILKSLRNPGIVSLLDYFVEDHRAYLVMEHLDGLNLHQLVQRDGALSEDKVRDLAFQMCEILQFLHAHGVVHRDFTPDNLILNAKGKLKLIDFNVAQQGEVGATGTIVGKHAYVPPEQFRGMATAQSDIYAFGASLFFLLTGHDPEPISQSSPMAKNPQVTPAWDQMVRKATALSVENRYSMVKDIFADLNADDPSETMKKFEVKSGG